MFAVYKKAAEDGGKKKKSLPYDDMANLHSKWFLRECGLGGRKKKFLINIGSHAPVPPRMKSIFRANLHFIHLNSVPGQG